MEKYMYGIQAAFYMDGLSAKEFYFVFIDKKPPYDVLIVKYEVNREKDRELYELGMLNIKRFEKESCPEYAMFNQIITL